MNDINSIYSELIALGLKITDYKKFMEFVRGNNNSYKEAIDKIKDTKNLKEKKVDYTDFEKNLVNYFKEMQNIINRDSLFNLSNEDDIDNFKKFFQSIVDKYIIIYKLKDDNDQCKKKYNEIQRLKSEIDKINNSYTSLSSDIIEQINDLKFKIDIENMEYRRLLTSIEETNKVITKYSSKIEFVNLIGLISNEMVKLSTLMNKLSLTNDSKDKLIEIFTNLNKYFKSQKIKCINDINDFNSLCNNAGLLPNEKDSVIQNSTTVENANENFEKYLSNEANLNNANKLGLVREHSLKVGDLVAYNGSIILGEYDYGQLLEPNVTYRVSKVDFDDKGNEIFFLEGSNVPFPVVIFDVVPESKYIIDKSNLVTYLEECKNKFDIRKIYRVALEGLKNKIANSIIKSTIKRSISEEGYDDLGEKYYYDNNSSNELLNLEEFSKIYDEVKNGKSR